MRAELTAVGRLGEEQPPCKHAYSIQSQSRRAIVQDLEAQNSHGLQPQHTGHIMESLLVPLPRTPGLLLWWRLVFGSWLQRVSRKAAAATLSWFEADGDQHEVHALAAGKAPKCVARVNEAEPPVPYVAQAAHEGVGVGVLV